MSAVQVVMNEAVRRWRARAEGGIAWAAERVDKAEWLRLALRAWRADEDVESRLEAKRTAREGVVGVQVEGVASGAGAAAAAEGAASAAAAGKRPARRTSKAAKQRKEAGEQRGRRAAVQ